MMPVPMTFEGHCRHYRYRRFQGQ